MIPIHMARVSKATNFYAQALLKAKADVKVAADRIQQRKADMQLDMAEMTRLERVIKALEAMSGKKPVATGLTAALRKLMDIATHPVTATEAVRLLEQHGYDCSNQKNPAAAVH